MLRRKSLAAAGKLATTGNLVPDASAWLCQSICDEATRWNATKITPLMDWDFANPELARKFGFDCMYIVHLPEGTDTPRAAQSFRRRNDVASAIVDSIGTVADTIPNDTHFDRLWAMRNTGTNTGASGGLPNADIDATGAWDIHTGAAGDVTIAIIDSGIDVHPDLTNVIAGRNTEPSSPPTLTTDDCSHGTHVAGTAAAMGNNATGVVGVSWGAKLMPVRVTDPLIPCRFRTSSMTAGIMWAADHGADVANLSLQISSASAAEITSMQNAIDYGRSLGMITVAATGNSNSCADLGGVCFPARLPRTIAVGATTFTDLPWSLANKGVEMDVAAPGDRIFSACVAGGQFNPVCDCNGTSGFYPGCDLYAYLSGTSMATPHVSGLIALLKSYSLANGLDLGLGDLEDIITTTTDDVSSTGWDDQSGYGRINAHEALLAAQVWPTILSSNPPNGAIDARQHTDRLNQQEFGVDFVDMDFPPDVASTLTVADFTVLQKGGMLAAPTVTDVQLLDADTVRVTLSRKLEPFSWTTVAHHDTGIVRIAFLPGDVDGDQVVNNDDAIALSDFFLGGGATPSPWSTDLDWSGATTPTDFLTLVDLLHGADLHENATDTTLP